MVCALSPHCTDTIGYVTGKVSDLISKGSSVRVLRVTWLNLAVAEKYVG